MSESTEMQSGYVDVPAGAPRRSQVWSFSLGATMVELTFKPMGKKNASVSTSLRTDRLRKGWIDLVLSG